MPKINYEIQPVEKKVVCISGVSSGIGKALILKYAREGFAVCGLARNQEKLRELEAELSALHANFLLIQADVSDEAQCKSAIRAVEERYGRLDVLINNAGISMRALFKDTTPDVLKKVMDINFWGTVYLTHAAMPLLLASKGVVCGISSVAGYKGLPARTGYSASKFAMQGFLEALRIENRNTGLGVVVVCPGFTASNIRQTALSATGAPQGESPRDEGKMMAAEKVADIVFKAVKKRKSFEVLTLQGKLVYWINKFFPKFVDGQVYGHLAKEPDSPFR